MVVNIRVRFWVPIVIRRLLFRVPKKGPSTHAVKGFRVEGLGWNMVSGWFMLGFPLPYVRGMRIMALQLLAA